MKTYSICIVHKKNGSQDLIRYQRNKFRKTGTKSGSVRVLLLILLFHKIRIQLVLKIYKISFILNSMYLMEVLVFSIFYLRQFQRISKLNYWYLENRKISSRCIVVRQSPLHFRKISHRSSKRCLLIEICL